MLTCGRYTLDLSRVQIMGVINLTPDSFSDGRADIDAGAVRDQALRLIEEGADLIDLGAESTRPGATPVPLEQELARLVPVLRALQDVQVPLSVDTYKPEVMRVALAEGASMINDVYGFTRPGAIAAISSHPSHAANPSSAANHCALCVMHMQGEPQTMQQAPVYADVTREVGAFLAERAQALCDAGVERSRIVLDPGFGFGKTLWHNYRLLHELEFLVALGYPVLAGLSRKGMLGAVTGRAVSERLPASLAAALFAIAQGASLVRVHDVAATRDALRVWEAAVTPDNLNV